MNNAGVQLALGCAILIVMELISYREVLVYNDRDKWVLHTQEVRQNLAEMLALMTSLEASTLRFALTADETDLAQQGEEGKTGIEQAETKLRVLMADNPAQLARLASLDTLAVELIRLAGSVAHLPRSDSLAATAVRKGPGLRIVADSRAIVGEMQREELRLLELRSSEAKASYALTQTLVAFASLFGLMITAFAAWNVWRNSIKRGLAEEALRDSEGRLHAMVQGVQDYGIVMLSSTGDVLSWNTGAEQMTGCSSEEMVGKPFSRFFLADDVDRGRPEEILQMASQQGLLEVQGMRARKDGSHFMVRATYTALRDQSGNLRGYSLISRDLTESAESGAKYRGLLEAAPDAMVVVNQSGEIVLVNVQAEKRFGYRRDELLGQPVTDIIPVGFAERLLADDLRSEEDALGQQIGTGIELSGRRKDGSAFPIEIMLSPLDSVEGILVTAAIRDISVRKAAETVLAQMEGRYRGLLEAAPDAMVVVNQSGEIVLVNVQAEKRFGYPRDELLGKRVTAIIPDGFAERLVADALRSDEDALAQQIGAGIELSGRRKDGSAFPIEIMLSPLDSTDGMLVTAAIRDISVRKAAETLLAQMEGRYRGLLEAAPDAMVVVNKDGMIVLVNVQAEKRFGYRRDELLGQGVTEIIPDGFAERLVADALRSDEDALAQQIGTGIELSGRRKDGSEFPIELMLSPLDSVDGFLVTAAIRDITVRRQAEETLLDKVKELNRSNEELGQFAYIASHDLQEPLRMVASYTQLLARRYKGKLDADADDFIAFAVDGATRMQRLIQDLLAYSRVETQGKVLVKISSDEALQQSLINLRGAIEESHALVTHDPLPNVLADRTQLVQLFQNLIGNAIKYQNSGSPIVCVSAIQNGANKIKFSVSDNGIGIDPQYFERIFGMFQRLHARDAFDGTGIGLAICKKIVERHGGEISVESKPGQGSTFSFVLAGGEAGI
jgi:PAS domain S-box-containing protein